MYNLLIVDDEYEIRNGLVKYFPWNKLGYQVVGQAENGKQAIDFIRNNHVDIMLCDIKLPFMSGIDVARELYNIKSKVKIVFLSAYKEFEFAKKALTYGVKDYVVKSATYDELIDTFSFIKNELDNDLINNEKENTRSFNIDEDVFNTGINEKIINTVKEYVANNYVDANLDDAAELVYLSPYYLSKYFKKYTGLTFSEYVLTIRMKKAAELLSDIKYKTYEVSEKVGYSNSKNFTRAFKSYFGKTPREFRQGEVSESIVKEKQGNEEDDAD